MHTLLLALTSPSIAATLTVDGDGGGDYDTIQAAIDAASSGDILTIAGGTYSECIDTSGKDLELQGAGADEVTINGRGDCTNAVAVQGGETVSIAGVEIRNSTYRAVYVEGSTLFLEDVEVRGSGTTYSGYGIDGGGLAVVGGSATLTGVELDGNEGYQGGNLYLAAGASVDISSSKISDGSAYYGGGIFIADDTDGASTLVLADSDVETNSGYYGGNGLYAASGAVVESSGNTWYANDYAYSSGGAAFLYGAAMSSESDRFRDNGSSTYYYVNGGAIYARESELSVADGRFDGNLGYP